MACVMSTIMPLLCDHNVITMLLSCDTHLPFPGTEHLEWQDLLVLRVPGYRLGVNDTGSDIIVVDLWHAFNDVWVLRGVVFLVSAVDMDLSAFQHVDLKGRKQD